MTSSNRPCVTAATASESSTRITRSGRAPTGLTTTAGWPSGRRLARRSKKLVFRDELGERTPPLNYDPTAIDGQGGGDPHAVDHGATVNKDVALVDAIDDDTEHDWFNVLDGKNRASHKTQRDAVLRKAMQRAAVTLEEEYDSDDPSDWLLENRQVEFSPLGASTPDRIPMSNRSSYQQSVMIGEGLDHSGSVLPPSNSGHQNAAELVSTQPARSRTT